MIFSGKLLISFFRICQDPPSYRISGGIFYNKGSSIERMIVGICKSICCKMLVLEVNKGESESA